MAKVTQIDKSKSDKRKAAIKTLKDRGPASKEKSVANLRERVSLLEDILGIV